MKILLLIICLLAAQVEAGMTTETDTLTVTLDPDSMSYQVCLHAPAGSEYDSLDFGVPTPGLAPRGARGHVRRVSAETITRDRGYSSYEAWSGSPLHQKAYRRVPGSGVLCSQWYRIRDLLACLERDSNVPMSAWAEVRVTFSLGVRSGAGVESLVHAASPWLSITPDRRKVLSERP